MSDPTYPTGDELEREIRGLNEPPVTALEYAAAKRRLDRGYGSWNDLMIVTRVAANLDVTKEE